jgi:type IV secretion system protein VirD4
MPVTHASVVRTILKLACCCVGFGVFLIGMQVPFALLLIAGGVTWNRFRRVAAKGWSHGSAIVASFGHLIHNRLLSEDGVILGTTGLMPRPTFREGLAALWSSSQSPVLACYLFLASWGSRKGANERTIRINDFVHLATFAPTGRGKSLYVLLINLFTYLGSCLVTDPKGELFIATALHRMKQFKHLIFNLDPFEICGVGTFTFNPLDCIDDAADDFIDQCRDLANMLIVRSGNEKDPHWNDSAELVLTAFIALVCGCEHNPKERNLGGVRALIASRDCYMKSIICMQTIESHHGVIKRLGEQLTWFADKELGSVMSTLQRQTAWLDSPVVARNMASSNFDPMALRNGRASVYLILPHDKLETLAPLMRCWIGVIIRTITRGKPTEKNPVVFFLDEAAHLGKIRVLEQAVTLMRGMGIRLWFFFQSIHQVQECYGEKAKTILDNIDTQQYFGTNSYEAAEELSKRIGETTISVVAHGKNDGRSRPTGGTGQESGSVSTGGNTNYSDTGRRLYKAEEILTLPKNVALVFHRHLPVIPSHLIPFSKYPEFWAGGIAGQPGLGRSATEKAVCLLVATLVFAALAFSLCPFDARPGVPAGFAFPQEGPFPEPSAEFPFPPPPGWEFPQ